MTTKPTKNLNWLVGNNAPFSTEPGVGLKQSGWQAGEAPGANHHNYMFANLDAWVRYLKERNEIDYYVGDESFADASDVRTILANPEIYGGIRIMINNGLFLDAAWTINKKCTLHFTENGYIYGGLFDPAIKIVVNETVKITGGKFYQFNNYVFELTNSASWCEFEGMQVSKYDFLAENSVSTGRKPTVRGIRYYFAD